MADIDPTYIGNTIKLFPELTPLNFVIMEDFASGYTRKDIAHHRGLSRQTVHRALKECCDVFECESIETVRTIYLNRRLKYFPV